VIANIFSIGPPILIIFLYSNYFEFNFNIGLLESELILYTTVPIKKKRSYMPKEEKIRVSNNIPD
jgi:hypothetical protein